MNKELLHTLLDKYITGTLSEQERLQLQQLLRHPEADDWVHLHLRGQYEQTSSELPERPAGFGKIRSVVLRKIGEMAATAESMPVRFLRRAWWRYAAAVLLILGAIALYFERPTGDAVAKNRKGATDVPAPAVSRATLTLADGRQIGLDSAASGLLAMQGNTGIQKTAEGHIQYKGRTTNGVQQYNVLTNPRGSEVVSVVLQDGTKVWLNAASSLRYPTTFSAKERNVEIRGEGYFEVAKNSSKPFTVTKGNTVVTVLGTEFNVNSYEEEEELKITLFQGAVKVHHKQNLQLLAPGQQARVQNNGTIQLLPEADLATIVAWKNGMFRFEQSDLKYIMRQLERWYDVEVDYPPQLPEKTFNGEIPRNAPVSEVLKILEFAGAQFKLENKKITVLK